MSPHTTSCSDDARLLAEAAWRHLVNRHDLAQALDDLGPGPLGGGNHVRLVAAVQHLRITTPAVPGNAPPTDRERPVTIHHPTDQHPSPAIATAAHYAARRDALVALLCADLAALEANPPPGWRPRRRRRWVALVATGRARLAGLGHLITTTGAPR